MKTLLTLFLPAFCVTCFAQSPTSTINKKGFEYRIKGLVELDGHLIQNDTCKIPFKLTVNLKGSKIIKCSDGIIYQERDCDKIGCEIIHLKKILSGSFTLSNQYGNTTLTPGTWSH